MLGNIKNRITLNLINRDILNGKYDIALDKLNKLISVDFRPSETYLARGILCRKLMMYENAYSDFTYIINNCVNKYQAYCQRLELNYELGNYFEAISDANTVLSVSGIDFSIIRLKILSLIFSRQDDLAYNTAMEFFDFNKYKILQFLFQEVAILLTRDEFSKGLKLLEFIDSVDKNNPIKLLKEANIFALVGEYIKQDEIMRRIDAIFPKYFLSHFHYSNMYQEKDMLEISFLLELKVFDKQSFFDYEFMILEGYKKYSEGHVIESKEAFESAIAVNPKKAEAYVYLAEVLQIMSGYDNPECKNQAEKYYQIALNIYEQEGSWDKVEEMKRQLKHLNSTLTMK